MDREQIKTEYKRRCREKATDFATKSRRTEAEIKAFMQGFLDGWASCTDLLKEAKK